MPTTLRIEDEEGNGPFRKGDGFGLDMNAMPGPYRDAELNWDAWSDKAPDKARQLFSFTCLHSFLKWVSGNDASTLDELNYKVVEYDVTRAVVASSPTQTVFDKLKARKRKAWSPLEFYNAHKGATTDEGEDACTCPVTVDPYEEP